MELKLLDQTSYPHDGYGAGSGTIDEYIYECPCGKGTVIYEKDNIPGFRDRSIHSTCKPCGEKYDFGRGTATQKN
ncbi:hypothetical protein G3M80_03110 [Bacillus altitudinis]|uniref:hypothetical protein n=1 Tax=Bacillus altitudinis TaxID=293387 RepID=UPI0013EEA54F|nr:hypothetical protein [Bacillus altitudinis]QII23605.1 hypothetical protein G3M80_03110 [Bacillus altitudinis]